MTAVLSLLAVVTLGLVVTRMASSALVLTGLSMDIARFQARSAFTGCGFTTQEAENMVRHPARRRIIMLLMLFGNAGLVTAVSSLLLSFANVSTGVSAWWRAAVIAAGLLGLWLLARSQWLDRHTSRLFKRLLQRWTTLEVRDYVSLLELTGDFSVAEMEIEEGAWLADRQLREMRLPDEGVTVLGIKRPDGDYVGVPSADEQLFAGDVVVLYGQRTAILSIDERTRDEAGIASRAASVDRETRRKQKQETLERLREEEIKEAVRRR